MPTVTTITRLQCEQIKRHLDEHPCDYCGGPVYVGDRSYHDESEGGLFCSVRCAEAERPGVEFKVVR